MSSDLAPTIGIDKDADSWEKYPNLVHGVMRSRTRVINPYRELLLQPNLPWQETSAIWHQLNVESLQAR